MIYKVNYLRYKIYIFINHNYFTIKLLTELHSSKIK